MTSSDFKGLSPLRMAAAAVLLLALSGVLSANAAPPAAGRHTVMLVRHGEKAAGDPQDPALSGAGEASARRLAALLHDARVDAVYSSPYRRTRQTAEPTATDHGLQVLTYDPARPATELAETLRQAPDGGTVLVVGHSNTVPALAAALCRCDVPPMADTEYGRYYRLELAGDAPARLEAGTW